MTLNWTLYARIADNMAQNTAKNTEIKLVQIEITIDLILLYARIILFLF